jgi:hypothetical protein
VRAVSRAWHRAVRKALVLAAGNGDRFHNANRQSKLLQPVLGRPLILRTLQTARDAGVASFEVVLGAGGPRCGRADDSPEQLQGHRCEDRAVQPAHLGADQHRPDPYAAHTQSALGLARGARILFGMALQPRAVLDGSAGRLPVAGRQRSRRLRRRDRPIEVSGIGARLLDRNRLGITRTTSRSSPA